MIVSKDLEEQLAQKITEALKNTGLWKVIIDVGDDEYARGYDHGFRNGRNHQRRVYKERSREEKKKAKK